MSLAENVSRARLALGLSRSELEQLAQLSRRAVERLEVRGQIPRDPADLERLAAALGTTVAALRGEGGATPAAPLEVVQAGLVARHGPEAVVRAAVEAAFPARPSKV